jgi:hypothetical protein
VQGTDQMLLFASLHNYEREEARGGPEDETDEIEAENE